MLRLLGSKATLCDGLTRRDVLRSADWARSASDLLRLQEAGAATPARSFGLS
jgi:hypothetical protein